MKNKLLVLISLILVMAVLYSPESSSQTPTYTILLTNDVPVSATEYQFDIYLLRTGTTPLELGGIQIGLLYNEAVKNGGTLTLSYVPGSVDPAIVASTEQNTFNLATSSAPGILRIVAHLASGGPGTGAIISEIAPGTRVGRLSLVNSVPFSAQNMSVKWSFGSPYASVITAYINGINTDITVPANHFVNLASPLLPVELTSFVYNVSGRQLNFNWETKTELNTNKFEIERGLTFSKDASIIWTSVGIIKAAGTSVSPKLYSFTEKNIQAGKYQYRLKMIDNDGTYKYSNVIETEVTFPKNFELSQNYPNPFNPSTTIEYQVPVDSKIKLEVYSITGEKVVELVNQDQQAGYYSVNFGSSTSRLASGVYFYYFIGTEKATGNNFSSVKKMVLLK